MKTKSLMQTLTVLALVILFSLPALACSLSLSNTSNTNSGNKETSLASAVNATINANIATQAAQATPTPPPAPTLPPPPVSTNTPEPTLPPVPTNALIPTHAPVPSGPWVGAITFASDISQDNQPINPGTVFKKGITHVYAFFPYSGIEQGKKITYYWTVNGKEFVSVIKTWVWDSSGTHPTSVSYSNNRQLDSGNWKLAIFYNNKLLASGTFKIMP
jgi:hypothetical protein